MKQKKTTIVSGITATGQLTLGNYISVIKNFVELQKDNNLIIFVANLHAITITINKEELQNNIKNMIALYYACGLKPKKVIIFIQSDITEVTLLFYILLCNTTIGELSRMTQFKDKTIKMKAKNKTEFIPTGLLIYPILMAADILLYDADFVLVGKDQKQHIELTRNIAKRINKRYKQKLFKIPINFTPSIGGKIMDLQNPIKKMSKSSNNYNSFISLLDEKQIVRKKICKTVTDSEGKIFYNPKEKPGISNLLTIYAVLQKITVEDTVKKFIHQNYNQLKNQVANEIIKVLNPIQKKYYKLIKNKKINELINLGTKKIKLIANKKIIKVKNAIGLNLKK